jgi:pentatricopeptide repeat protein
VRSNDVARGVAVLDRMAADGVEPDEYTDAVVGRKRVLRSHLRKLFY